MSSYTAIIKCKKCGKVLAEINAYHEPRSNCFVPQDIITEEFGLSSIYCQDCLNGRDSTDYKAESIDVFTKKEELSKEESEWLIDFITKENNDEDTQKGDTECQ